MISGCMMAIPKQLAKKLTANIVTNNLRTFYNGKETAQFLAEELRQRRVKFHETTEVATTTSLKFGTVFKRLTTSAAPEESDFSFNNMEKWLKHMIEKTTIKDQSYNKQRHCILGNDLAAAHFLLYRGGKVKFKNHTEWLQENAKDSIPNVYDPNYYVEAIDLNGFNIYYEGLENLFGLKYLKWISFKGCPLIDDWYIDKISAEFPTVEYLDISECQKVTERGLESLYRMPNLRRLIVTNHYNSSAFELTCLMLEDVNPYLKVEMQEATRKMTLDE